MSVKEIPKYPYAFLRDILHVGGGGGGGVGVSIIMLSYVAHANYEGGKRLISILGGLRKRAKLRKYL